MMTKMILAAAAAATLLTAAPASAAQFVFNFGTGGTAATTSGNSYGNSQTFTLVSGGETLQLRVSAFSVVNNQIVQAFVGRYDNGLGVINPNDGGSNYHAVDNIGSTDFLVFQLSKVASVTSATTVAYADDSDFLARLGSTQQAWNQALTSTNINFTSDKQVTGNGGTLTRSLFATSSTGNLLLVQAGGTDNLADAFKLRSLTFVTPAAAPVPEPATWAMMIAGFGLVGTGLRRRRSKNAPHVLA
ncbi:hypothetical protein GGR88_002714 [Sphingomonas jejuensis]|uniref:Ice-binding protein C-terminal domain-containing protein n=1 Tax=Sphingomonas jejuensis TaxID=904715 RepID=A0ABX0XPH0_9SPHN|nr:PEPxxWA-CTERM sorting domain-containing protein [Sphingomonas jejuensis]NJC35200.1 hypothetical protein [Sphingomonas jejuensis]